MRTTFISTAALWNSPRSSLDRLQSELVKTNKELVSGRHADVGLELGHKTGQTLSLRQQRVELDAMIDSNASVILRLKSTTTVLSQVREVADKFKDALIANPLGDSSIAIVKSQAEANLNGLLANLNKDAGGQYLFGGINTKDKPLNDFSSGAPVSAKTAVATAFSEQFGISQDDPAVSAITPAQMKVFLEDSFASLFDADWGTYWSKASDHSIQSLISPTERVETSVSANEAPVRQLAMAYTMASELGITNLSDETREFLVAEVLKNVSTAVAGLNGMEARLGIVQEKTEKANERMDLQKTIYDEKIVQLEAVDPAEAKIRIDQLTTQIQTSYSLTAQLRQLSLINFL